MVSIIQEIRERLKDIGYRRTFGAENIRRDFAHAILDARKGKGLTQSQLAELADVSQAYISKLESGEANPTIGHIGSIAAAMWLRPRVTFYALLSEESEGNVPRITPSAIHSAGEVSFWPSPGLHGPSSADSMASAHVGRGTANVGDLCFVGLMG